MKCREYNACFRNCLECDIKKNIKCSKIFNFDIAQKYISVKRNDINCSWNECPTCGKSIGYHPKETFFRCSKCGQKILW